MLLNILLLRFSLFTHFFWFVYLFTAVNISSKYFMFNLNWFYFWHNHCNEKKTKQTKTMMNFCYLMIIMIHYVPCIDVKSLSINIELLLWNDYTSQSMMTDYAVFNADADNLNSSKFTTLFHCARYFFSIEKGNTMKSRNIFFFANALPLLKTKLELNQHRSKIIWKRRIFCWIFFYIFWRNKKMGEAKKNEIVHLGKLVWSICFLTKKKNVISKRSL